MKKSELRQLIQEEIRTLLSEKIDREIETAIRNNIITSADEDYKKFAKSGKFSDVEPKWEWDLQGGRQFVKIIRDDKGSRSVWGFVAQIDGILKGIPYKRGDVFKAASFNAPAKHKRGNVFVKQNWHWTGPDYLI
ncbi:MAG: hypothetical protein JETCAE03_33340 [Ignavibacteriaceae bacterium]|jgi:hypothetical protein|nr:MAG: hypothetical protein JETCAE03_33340 [Ignavibacteriaceae bacterium]